MGKVCFSVTSTLLHLLFTGNLLSPSGKFLLILQHPIQGDLFCFVSSDLFRERDSNLSTLIPEPTLLTFIRKN